MNAFSGTKLKLSVPLYYVDVYDHESQPRGPKGISFLFRSFMFNDVHKGILVVSMLQTLSTVHIPAGLMT